MNNIKIIFDLKYTIFFILRQNLQIRAKPIYFLLSYHNRSPYYITKSKKIDQQLEDARILASLNSSSSQEDLEAQQKKLVSDELRGRIMDEDGNLNA